jgi:hypothetical protein
MIEIERVYALQALLKRLRVRELPASELSDAGDQAFANLNSESEYLSALHWLNLES